MSVGRRIVTILVAALLAAGMAVTGMTWLATGHGSVEFNSGLAWGRILLQLAASLGIVSLLVILSRAGEHN